VQPPTPAATRPGVFFIARYPSTRSLSLSLLVAILVLLRFLKKTETNGAHRQNSSGGSGSGDHYCLRLRCMLGTYIPPLNFLLNN
jgi:hypothetical protein